MPKPSRVFSETIRLEKEDYLKLKAWLTGKTNYDGEFLTKKDLHKLLVRTFLAKQDWQETILEGIEIVREVYQKINNP